MKREEFCYAFIKQNCFHAVSCSTVSFMGRDQVCFLTEQFLVETCQNQHELQNKYMNICLFELLPYDLEISGVSGQQKTTKSREECKAWSSNRHYIKSMCHMQCKQETFPRGKKIRQGTRSTI